MRLFITVLTVLLFLAGCSTAPAPREDVDPVRSSSAAREAELPPSLQGWRDATRSYVRSILIEGSAGDLGVLQQSGRARPADVARAYIMLEAAAPDAYEDLPRAAPILAALDQGLGSSWLGARMQTQPRLDRRALAQINGLRGAFAQHRPAAVLKAWYGTMLEIDAGRSPSVSRGWNPCPVASDPLDVAITLGELARIVGASCSGDVAARAKDEAILALENSTGSVYDRALMEALGRVPNVDPQWAPAFCDEILGRTSDFLISVDVPLAFACFGLMSSESLTVSDAVLRSLRAFVGAGGKIPADSEINSTGLQMEVGMLNALGLADESGRLSSSRSVIESQEFYDEVRVRYGRRMPPPSIWDVEEAVADRPGDEDSLYSAALVIGSTQECPGDDALRAIQAELGTARSVLREAALWRALDVCSRSVDPRVRRTTLREASRLLKTSQPLVVWWEAAEATCLLGEQPTIGVQKLRHALPAVSEGEDVNVVDVFAGARIVSFVAAGCPSEPWPVV